MGPELSLGIIEKTGGHSKEKTGQFISVCGTDSLPVLE
jgi:hypothetical protein